mgnify:CR=1 FL=1
MFPELEKISNTFYKTIINLLTLSLSAHQIGLTNKDFIDNIVTITYINKIKVRVDKIIEEAGSKNNVSKDKELNRKVEIISSIKGLRKNLQKTC